MTAAEPAKLAIITGGSRGIGAATCRALAADGYRILLNYHSNADAAANVVAAIEAAGGQASAVQGDIGTPAGVEALFSAADSLRAQGHAPHVLVNNAGIIGDNMSLEYAADPVQFDRMMRTNVWAPTSCTARFVELVEKHRGVQDTSVLASQGVVTGMNSPSVVNVSSGAAALPTGLYGMSKAALNGLQIFAAPELAKKNIRFNAVAPGMTATDMIQELATVGPEAIPLKRFGTAEEIAEAIRWLVSDKASYVAGANLRISGARAPGVVLG